MEKIITNGAPKEQGDEIYLAEAKIKYWQNPDCTEDADEIGYQEIVFSTRDNGMEKFLHIKTEGWSIDNVDSLIILAEDFKKRIGYE